MTAPPQAAVLVLEDGRTCHGRSFGAPGETLGEAVLATGTTGHQEALTDPSAHPRVVVATTPHVGSNGWDDDESRRIGAARRGAPARPLRRPAGTAPRRRCRRGRGGLTASRGDLSSIRRDGRQTCSDAAVPGIGAARWGDVGARPSQDRADDARGR